MGAVRRRYHRCDAPPERPPASGDDTGDRVTILGAIGGKRCGGAIGGAIMGRPMRPGSGCIRASPLPAGMSGGRVVRSTVGGAADGTLEIAARENTTGAPA
jgi:hypothetical protein